MSCKNCGKLDNPDESNFCNRCGVSLERQGSCAICFQDNQLLLPLSCGHSFCRSYCYNRCCKKCPICRKMNTFLEGTTTQNIYKIGCSRCNSMDIVPKNFHLKCQNCSHEFLEINAKRINIYEKPIVLAKELFPNKNRYMCYKCSWMNLFENIEGTKCGGCQLNLSRHNTRMYT
jgi:hypothetical protein